MTDAFLLETAMRIAERLADAQLRDGSWPCAEMPDEESEAERAAQLASLYSGSAGIALFLAQAADGPGRLRDAAHAGLRHAASAAPEGARAASLFQGSLGTAYALHRAGLADEAARLLRTAIAAAKPHQTRLDVISGSAGAIPALLAMRGQPGALDYAAALGRDLCARADWEQGCCSWDARDAAGFAAGAPLAGFSHGASGMALALLRLYEVAGDEDFLVTARGAYAYEETLRRGGRWLDLRFVDSAAEAEAKGHWPSVWCHGAAGIALSHLEAARIDTEEAHEHLRLLALAVQATQESLREMLAAPRADATLCHGIAGLCEILNLAGAREAAVEGATEIARRYGERQDWPSGLPDGRRDLSLMLGDAGIGHAMLRLARPQAAEPVLLIR